MLEESSVSIKIRLVAPVPPKEFDSGADKWYKNLKASPNKIRRGANKPLKKFKDYIIKPDARHQSITEAELLKKPVYSDNSRYHRRFRRNVRRAHTKNGTGVSKFDARIDDKAKEKYERTGRERNYPLFGSAKDGVKGLIFLGLMALGGDGRLKQCLKPGSDEIITGKLLTICPPEKLKDFRKYLRWEIAESGAAIIKNDFSQDTVNSKNVTLNRFVNRYRLDELAPFELGGASHIDFVVVEIADPAQPGEKKKWLGLDIQVSIKRATDFTD